MKLKVSHTTVYTYDHPVSLSHNIVRLTPRVTEVQRCLFHRISITPTPATRQHHVDYFGNHVGYLTVIEPHQRLQVTASSEVEIELKELPDPEQTLPWEDVAQMIATERGDSVLEAFQLVLDSPRVTRSAELADYARPSFAPGRPVLAAAIDLNHRIHTDFTYDPEATTVSTSIAEVLHLRRGVCQDLTHVAIAALRSLGLAARYVSGYLRTRPPPGKQRLVGADASHAWLSVYCGPAGWIDLDPTNDLLPQTEHVAVAWGRDYGDVCPIAGIYLGGGQHRVRVGVDVIGL